MNFNGGSGNTATESDTYNVTPFACTIKKLTLSFAIAPGAGNNRSITLRKAGASQALTATISETATTATDNTNTVDLVADDLVNYVTTPVSSPTAPTQTRAGAVVFIAVSVAATMRMIYRKN
jgi:hypothetical protein